MQIESVLYYARVKRIEFKDFRNIELGNIDFPNAEAQTFYAGEPSVLGLYGQNGSGKSSVIMALGILKEILSGRSIGDNYLSCVRMGKDKCTLSFVFSMFNRVFDENKNIVNNNIAPCIDIFYSFDIIKKQEEKSDKFDVASSKESLHIKNEVLKIKITDCKGTTVFPKQIIFDTRKESSDDKGIAFGSEQKHKLITQGQKDLSIKFQSAKAIAEENGTSFIFSLKFESALAEAFECFVNDPKTNSCLQNFDRCISKHSSLTDSYEDAVAQSTEEFPTISIFSQIIYIMFNLRIFGQYYLQVIDTATTGIININTQLPILLWGSELSYKLSLNMDKPTFVSEDRYNRVINALKAVSLVLNKIVPDMSLDIADLGKYINRDNTEEHCFEIMSKRNGQTIPLKYESDGIRRMVSILSLLIAVYNEESFTVAIDEIDSGIFEYLLGEVLSVMSESIKGQFVFTSHNLRPLEVLPAKYLCFTTANPKNRFTTLPRRGNSNLRDTYFRNIVLGTKDESIYNPTDRYEIERAFYKAGHPEDDET